LLLNCHTCYSFRYGIFSCEALLEEVQRNGYESFVISDINNTSAILEIVRLSQEIPVKPIAGIDFRNGISQQYVGIARNNNGFRELNEHLTDHLHNEKDFDPAAPAFSNAYIVYPFHQYTGWPLRENEFIGVATKDLPRLPFSKYRNYLNRMVVLQPFTFKNKRDFNAHRLLRAIDKNVLLSKLPVTAQSAPDETIMPEKEIWNAYREYPVILQNTRTLMNDCGIHFAFGKMSSKNPKHLTGSVAGDMELLKQECRNALTARYGNPVPGIVTQRVEKELQIIEQMNFASYFLINFEIVRYAQRQGYYYVGRGSGANSVVAYLLRITDVDPIDLDLYFERFINPHRNNPPDFDIDFSWTDRDDMTRFIFERFGKTKTALLGAYNTFQNDAVIRELGKVFGLPLVEIDYLQNAVRDNKDVDQLGKLVLKYADILHGLPSHLSIHSSGILISEEPITTYSATFIPPKGYPTTQFSMLEAEDIGLCKFDILSQRGLGKIKDTITLVKKNKGVDVDIHDMQKLKQDEKIKEQLRSGKAIGCFYVESPAMRMLLAKLRADDYLRLVAASSIIRPGVAKSGMMREYILRYRQEHLREKARREIPELYDILQETYGVMVYQEDVIKVAHFFAGLSLADADYLRRGMSWKFKQRNEFWKVQKNFFSNCRKKGYAEKTINDIWLQIESFANYAFSKGHSASYAVESYQALYLKAYFPHEYMVATLNNGGGFYRTEFYVHEARMSGAKIQAPCINKSEGNCIIEGDEIYLGLAMIAELGQNTVENILTERNKNGNYEDLADFVKRTSVSIEQLRLLVRASAFRFTGKNRRELLWDAHSLVNPLKKESHTNELFDIKPRTFKLPVLENSDLDDAFDEMELLGFPLGSPFLLLRDELKCQMKATEIPQNIGKIISIAGYLVTTKVTQTTKGDRMYFGTFLDIEGNWIDTVHFPPVAKQFPFRGKGCYLLTGKVTEEFDFVSIEVTKMERLPFIDREK
jgi:DNA polymerase III subunit alpha